jgi:hypothetical protein
MSPAPAKLAGRRFNKLTAIEFVGRREPSNGNRIWRFRCDCGKEIETIATRVVRGLRISCGCANNHAHTTEHRANISRGLKKYNDKHPEAPNSARRKKISDAVKKAYGEGRLSKDISLRNLSRARQKLKANPELLALGGQRGGSAKRGLPQRKGSLNEMGPLNHNGKRYGLISPDGVRYHALNLNDFIRTHHHLFDPRDVDWKILPKHPAKGLYCRAQGGLRSLFVSNPEKQNSAWKNWQAFYGPNIVRRKPEGSQ